MTTPVKEFTDRLVKWGADVVEPIIRPITDVVYDIQGNAFRRKVDALADRFLKATAGWGGDPGEVTSIIDEVRKDPNVRQWFEFAIFQKVDPETREKLIGRPSSEGCRCLGPLFDEGHDVVRAMRDRQHNELKRRESPSFVTLEPTVTQGGKAGVQIGGRLGVGTTVARIGDHLNLDVGVSVEGGKSLPRESISYDGSPQTVAADFIGVAGEVGLSVALSDKLSLRTALMGGVKGNETRTTERRFHPVYDPRYGGPIGPGTQDQGPQEFMDYNVEGQKIFDEINAGVRASLGYEVASSSYGRFLLIGGIGLDGYPAILLKGSGGLMFQF